MSDRKILVLGLFLLAAGNSFAEPTDQDEIADIGVGTVIQFITDVNVKPHTGLVGLANGSLDSRPVDGVELDSKCSIVLKEKSEIDRIVLVGTSFVVTAVEKKSISNYAMYDLKLNSTDIESVRCSKYSRGAKEIITIGELKKHLNGFASVKLANPTIIH